MIKNKKQNKNKKTESHRSQILHGLYSCAPKTRAAFSKTWFLESTPVYLSSVLGTRVYNRKPRKKKRNVLISPAILQPLVRAREKPSYAK